MTSFELDLEMTSRLLYVKYHPNETVPPPSKEGDTVSLNDEPDRDPLPSPERTKLAQRIWQLRARLFKQRREFEQKGGEQREVEILKKTTQLRRNTIAVAKKECIALLFTVIEEILHDELIGSKRSLTRRLRSELNQLYYSSGLTVHVSAEDFRRVSQEFANDIERDKIRVITDKEVTPGCAMITSPTGSVEINWIRHLELLRRSVTGEVEELPSPILEGDNG